MEGCREVPDVLGSSKPQRGTEIKQAQGRAPVEAARRSSLPWKTPENISACSSGAIYCALSLTPTSETKLENINTTDNREQEKETIQEQNQGRPDGHKHVVAIFIHTLKPEVQ